MTNTNISAAEVYVGLIEWSSEDGDRDPIVLAAATQERTEHELAATLATEHQAAPDYFVDDAPAYLADPRGWLSDSGLPFGPLTAAAWLDGLREATTAPYWTIHQVAIAGQEGAL